MSGKFILLIAVIWAMATAMTTAAGAQEVDPGIGAALGELTRSISDNGQGSASLSGRIIQMIGLMTILSLAPGLLIVMTSFTRFVIVFSMLRSALGLGNSPPNMVITSLSLFMTLFVMQPVLETSWTRGVAPLIEERITEEVALQEISQPFHRFMAVNTREQDISLFVSMTRSEEGAPVKIASAADAPWSVLVPAFMISELKRAFTIGFLIYMPFIAIDLIVASVLMSAGMMMVSPVMISLPFKIIFFVLVDGWYMLAGSLMKSYATG